MLHDMAPTELICETILAHARNLESTVSDELSLSLAPLIERMFRYTWYVATE
ncbi:MAG: hypothetical protein OXI01_05570 [Albidovulum sp.]|nr:hypothetical protein [Albidovulum sp.]